MTTSTDDNRLGILEGRLIELSATVQELRADFRELSNRLDAGMQQVNARIDAGMQQVNARIDRLFLAMLGIGAAQIALLITLIIRSG
jgi:chromosome segregation ATPase